MLQAVADGAGIGLLPRYVAERLEATGQLVPLLPGWEFGAGALWLVWPASRRLSPRVRAFVDHAVTYAETRGFLEERD